MQLNCHFCLTARPILLYELKHIELKRLRQLHIECVTRTKEQLDYVEPEARVNKHQLEQLQVSSYLVGSVRALAIFAYTCTLYVKTHKLKNVFKLQSKKSFVFMRGRFNK